MADGVADNPGVVSVVEAEGEQSLYAVIRQSLRRSWAGAGNRRCFRNGNLCPGTVKNENRRSGNRWNVRRRLWRRSGILLFLP